MSKASPPAVARTVEYAEGLVNRCRAAISSPDETEEGQKSSTDSTRTTQNQEMPADDALLDPDQRVKRLLEENDGRLWQRELVEECPKSSSTVSRWLTDLEERGEITRVQVGREKLVTLPECGFDIVESNTPPAPTARPSSDD